MASDPYSPQAGDIGKLGDYLFLVKKVHPRKEGFPFQHVHVVFFDTHEEHENWSWYNDYEEVLFRWDQETFSWERPEVSPGRTVGV